MAKAALFNYNVIETKEHIISGLFASRILRRKRTKELNQVYRYLIRLGTRQQSPLSCSRQR
jgi:hypothetical protein